MHNPVFKYATPKGLVPIRPSLLGLRPVPKPPAPLKPVVRPAPPPPPPTPVRVLLIGNNYCGTPNELAGCAQDIDRAKAWFTANTPAGYALHFYELGDRWSVGENRRVVAGPQGTGTGANILAGLEWLTAKARAGDVMYVHYSGHGAGLPTADPAETSHVSSAWVPLDYQTFRGGNTAGFVQDDELRRVAVQRVPAGATLWVTSDSCHSGTVMDLRYNYRDASFRTAIPLTDPGVPAPWTPDLPLPKSCKAPAVIEYNPATAVSALLTVENKFYAPSAGTVFLLAGCMDTQTSADTYEDNLAQGALSWALFSCLAKAPASPVKYLMKDIRALLKLHGYSQQPQLSAGKATDLSKSLYQFLFKK
jgi:hypothetical protein